MIRSSLEFELKGMIDDLKDVMYTPSSVEKDEGMGRAFTKRDLHSFVDKLTNIMIMLVRRIEDIEKEIDALKED